MRADLSHVEDYRVGIGLFSSKRLSRYGAFSIPFNGRRLRVIVAPDISDDGTKNIWEHVSVSLENRCPNWIEMCFIKDLFFEHEDVCLQFHPKKSEYVNNHQYCLHIWKYNYGEIPTPPTILVGIK